MRIWTCVVGAMLGAIPPYSLSSQTEPSSPSSLERRVLRLARLTAVTGYEDAAAESVLVALPGAVRDAAGNVVLTRGRGLPARVAACFLDEPGHVVGGITADGYLTLRRAGSPPEGVAPERFLFGQRVTVYGADGPVEGVAGVRSIHLQRGRSGGAPPADAPPGDLLDEIFVDVGAADAREARSLGIRPALPVARSRQVQRYGPDLVAAPQASGRAACAALLDAALHAETPRAGSSVVAFTVHRYLGWVGAASAIARAREAAGAGAGGGPEVVLLGEAGGPDSLGRGVVVEGELDPEEAARVGGAGRFRVWRLPTRYAGTPVETVSLHDAGALAERLRRFLDGEP